ncbi:MAG: HAD-IC family P-type ATPase [Bilophila wadsworthia]
MLLLYANDEAKRAAFLLLAVVASEQPSGDVAVCGENLPEPAGRPSWGPFLRYIFVRPFMPVLVRVATAVAASVPFILKGVAALCRGRLSVDVLDAAAIGISLLRRDFKTARLLTLLLGFGEALEAWTRKKSLDTLAQSLALDVDTVWVRREAEMHVAISELSEDDLVIVRTGSAIPVDGVVAKRSLRQSGFHDRRTARCPAPPVRRYTPGLWLRRARSPSDPRAWATARASGRLSGSSRIPEALKAGVQGKAERLADAVVPFSFLLAGFVWLVTRNPARAASVLLVDYSCALKLSTPLAVLAAMKEGVGRGVLVRAGGSSNRWRRLTPWFSTRPGPYGIRPRVAEVIPGEGYERDDILRTAACLEEHFPHPVARAVVRKAEQEGLHHQEEHTEVEYVVAHGIASRLHGKRVLFGSRHYIHHDEGVPVDAMREDIERLAREGRSILYLAVDGKLAGLIAIEDPLRPEAAPVIRKLLGGNPRRHAHWDDERTAAAVAERLGISEYRSQVLPTDKAEVIRSLQAEGHTVAMLGDGINDSPALSAADVGVTLSDGADLAREVADVVLTECRLDGLVTAVDLSKAAMRRIRTDFGLIMTLNTVFLASGLAGFLQPGPSALLHNLTTVGVSLNAMRPMLKAGAEPQLEEVSA